MEIGQKQQHMIWNRNSRKQRSDLFRFQIFVISPMEGTTGWPSEERSLLSLHWLLSKTENWHKRRSVYFPQGIPAVEFHFPGEHFVASIQAIVTMLHIVGLAGEVRGIDPGRPGVPEFGRRIFNLRMSTHIEADLPIDTLAVTLAEQRKLNALPGSCYKQGQAGSLRQAYQSFMKRLRGVCFSGIVFDYDGTKLRDTGATGIDSPDLASKPDNMKHCYNGLDRRNKMLTRKVEFYRWDAFRK